MYSVGRFLVCSKCGLGAGERVVGLACQCVGGFSDKAKSLVKCWARGIHPDSKEYLGVPKKVARSGLTATSLSQLPRHAA